MSTSGHREKLMPLLYRLFAQSTLEGLYVDDWTSGGEDENHAYALYKTTSTCFSTGGFKLRKWASNDKKVIEKITLDRLRNERLKERESPPKEEESFAKLTVGGLDEIDPEKEHKVLGSNWNLSEDTFVIKLYKVVEFAKNLEPTKRNVLRMAAKLFDPLGLVSPVTVVFRMLLQELCLNKCEWDSTIPEHYRNQFQKWMADLDKVRSVSISRYYFPGEKGKVRSASLHGFGDASKGAYCAVVYLCIETEDGYKTSLVASKTRVTPSTPMTIPRLELLAALILARLISTVREALAQVLKIEEILCWTDSMTVYYWIHSNREYKQFVQNRVDEIHKLTDVKSWRHCPGVENPADVGSRGCLASELVDHSLWWEGPDWLNGPPKNYPNSEVSSEEDMTEECRKEFKAKERNPENAIALVNLTQEPSPRNPVKLTEVIDCERFSNATKLFRVTALSLKFIRNLKSAKNERKEAQSKEITLTAEEISEAKVLWISEMQKPLEREANFENLKRQLGLFRGEDSLLKCKGRLGNAPLSVTTRYPALLPRRHHVTRLIVEACHRKSNHAGVKETLVELRSEYWIPKGRQFVKKILHQCVTCKKLEGMPYRPPPSADLPETRVTGSPAFKHVGVDFAGPLFVKTTGGTVKEKKAYICLYTCATSRALHLELVPDLSSEAFIRCLRRFTARRGTPASITSDNAKTFKKANKDLVQLFHDKRTQDFAANQGIKWNFILEKAPWWGGYYERMVQLVKRSLRKVLGKAQLSYEELLTVLTEVEGVLNSRPLTYVYSDIIEELLTPSHLVFGRRLATLPDRAELSDDEDSASKLQRRARYLSKLLEHFWKRWSNEYLVGLREFHHCGAKGGQDKEIKIGDVVLIHDDSMKRSSWRLGEVTEMIESGDGRTRGAVLRVTSKKGKHLKLRRPIQKLYPLEVNTGNRSPLENEQTGVVQQPEHPTETSSRPPRRTAAANADVIRRLIDQQ